MNQNLSSIRDNKNRGKVGDYLNEIITSNSELSIVSAYFTIYAYKQLKDKLDNIKELRFLFGEPSFLKSIDPSKVNKKDFEIEEDKIIIPLTSRLTQKSIALECSEWIKDKVQVRSLIKPNFLHGKLYHIQQESGVNKAILGSSNFTVNGLGLGSTPNMELNIIIDSDRERNDLKLWFDELWNDESGELIEDVKDTVLKNLEQLYIENEPEFIYFKTLFHVFENFINEQNNGGLLNERTGFFNSEIWGMLYEFQKDGVKGAINKILKHNGCILADSVGLGKTFEALAVIRYFELMNYRILVLCPKKLSNNWTIYQSSQANSLNPFTTDKFNYSVMYHTDLGRANGRSAANGIDLENTNWGAWDLIVIDESHNFRGNPMERTTEDGDVKINRAKFLMDKIIKEGVNTKVLLLSATPVNNSLKDIRNQIYLITEGKDAALDDSSQIKDIGRTLKNAQTQFTNWVEKKDPNKSTKQLIEKLDSSFFKLLDELTIARSRKHIINFYKAEKEIGKFPIRLKPIPVYSAIDLKDRFHTYDELNKIIEKYKLSVFNPSAYIKADLKASYEDFASKNGTNFKQSDREYYLIGMMKVNFLKRLESSVESFEISLDRTIKKIVKLEERINRFIDSKDNSEEIDLFSVIPNEDEIEENDDEQELWQEGKKMKFNLADLNLDLWLSDLKKDRDGLIGLYNFAAAVTPERDAKLFDLKKLIEDKIKTPLNKGNKKVIVFTAFADTASYLYDSLLTWVHKDLKLNIALVAGSESKTTMGNNNYSHILTNFSPRAKNRAKMPQMEQMEEIDILIATDCISEGQNLQDCDYLINYDIHWNPVRIIQRFGRIDRLGSINESIQLVNFWPTNDLDKYINLKTRVEARMALVDITASDDDNILSNDQIEDLIKDDLKYRNKQLKKLQNEVVLDLEDMDDSISLSDFTLDDFRTDLSHYIETNKKKLEDAPLGLYAVVRSPVGEHKSMSETTLTDTEKSNIQPGVVYCLRQKNNSSDNEQINPLQPYFLVYIGNDGTVRYNYTHAKHIFEIYRNLCSGKNKAYEALCDMFNLETNQGKDMDQYSDLLIKAIDTITKVANLKSNQKIAGSDRTATIVPQSYRANDTSDFDLITWLIIK